MTESPLVSINAGSGKWEGGRDSGRYYLETAVGVAKIGFGINIKAVPAVLIAKSFHFFKRGTKLLMK